MALVPKRVKFRKTQRGSRKGFATRCITLAFGSFGLQSLDRCWLTNIQIEAARVALTRNMNRKGKLWIRIFPDKSVTARPLKHEWVRGKDSLSFGWQLLNQGLSFLSSTVFWRPTRRSVSDWPPASCRWLLVSLPEKGS